MTTVCIEQGILKGAICYTDEGNEYFEFLCIPYAKPPVGNLRFKSPQPPEPWDGVKDTTTISESQVPCQMDLFKNQYIGTEDCLYLSVSTPKLPSKNDESELLPVMIHIHGGGFLHGNGIYKNENGPDYLIDNDVVVVSINYRLGIFGFLSLDLPEAAGNMGLKDQMQALIWVQNNINKFGGDKNNVTIFGISAGAASIEYLMLNPKAKGLFHRAILQSGSSLNHWAINFEPQKLLQKVLHLLEYQGSAQDHRAVYEYLMVCPPEILTEKCFEAIEKNAPKRSFFGFVPTIERDFGNGEAFLTTHPYELLKEGKFNKIPVIKGFCEMEGYMMYLMKPTAVEELNINENFLSHLAYSVETDDCGKFNEKFSKAYNKTTANLDVEPDRHVIDFFSDYDFISGVILSARIMSDHGADVYLYKFSYDGKANFLKSVFGIRRKGAAHADDVTYILKVEIPKLVEEDDIVVRDKVTKLWTNFAKTRSVLKIKLVDTSLNGFIYIAEEGQDLPSMFRLIAYWRKAELKNRRVCMKRFMNVKKAKEVCKDRAVLHSVLSAYAGRDLARCNPIQPAPSTEEFPIWLPVTGTSIQYLNIDKKFTIESYQDTDKMEIFKELYEKYQM